MTIGYLKRMRDQFLKEYEEHSKTLTDQVFARNSLRITKAVLNAFIEIIEEQNK